MGQIIKEPKAHTYLLLTSEIFQINGIQHMLRAWRVEKLKKGKKGDEYEFAHFCLTHSDNKGNMHFQQNFDDLTKLSRQMSQMIHDLRTVFSTD